MLRCVLFEDEHLLVVNKPPGVNTHAPAPYAGEGLYDWLRSREPRWAALAVIHRLDKETSGVMVFAKSRRANQSLTRQFTERKVRKSYLLLTDRKVPAGPFTVKTAVVRAGERYWARPGDDAITRFRRVALPGGSVAGLDPSVLRSVTAVEAEPLTGRTHQIRVHAAHQGLPILGDALYGGTPANRVFLHARSIAFRHPTTDVEVSFEAPTDFHLEPRLQIRSAFIEPELTDCFRLLHGAADGLPGAYLDKLGPYLLLQTEQPLDEAGHAMLLQMVRTAGAWGASHKLLRRDVRGASGSEANPQPIAGEPPPERFLVIENGLQYELSFSEGYSVGLFLDQRDNRRRLLTGWVGPRFAVWPEGGAGEVLNTFAYTCAFSVCAAKAGARVTSIDLSKKYLEWGRRNFDLNGIASSEHDFIYGDTFQWLKRLARKGRHFDLILLDPPTFSQSKVSGVFRAEKHYVDLVTAALPLLKAGGILFASSNAAGWPAEAFMAAIEAGLRRTGRSIRQQQYVPQPPDFPVSRAEPAYLKTVWTRVN